MCASARCCDFSILQVDPKWRETAFALIEQQSNTRMSNKHGINYGSRPECCNFFEIFLEVDLGNATTSDAQGLLLNSGPLEKDPISKSHEEASL